MELFRNRLGSGLKTRHMQLLVALDELRNMHDAAEATHMTQPGASKMLKDVEERIPIDGNRLKYWYSSNGPYRKCFVKIPMGEVRSLIFVDLQMLSEEFEAQFAKNNQG